MARPKKKALSDNPDFALRQLADQLATGSIVNQALARYLYQIMEFFYDEYIAPKDAEIARLKKRVSELEAIQI
jgi:hypothetical protein